MAAHAHLPASRRSLLSGFIAVIVAVLVFISGLAVTVAGAIDGLVGQWNASVTGTLTAQLPGQGVDAQKKAQAALAAARTIPEVKRADIVSREASRKLLEPWLGDAALIDDLPLPVLIDIELAQPSALVVEKVARALKEAAPEVAIDDHRVWLNRIADFASALGYVAFVLIGLSLGALALSVTFATRASLTEFMHVIEVLHLVGARDRYIAAQFSWRALRQALYGGLIGLVAFAPALAAMTWLSRRMDPGIMPALQIPLPFWIGLGALPLAAAVIAYSAALMTVRRHLRTMV